MIKDYPTPTGPWVYPPIRVIGNFNYCFETFTGVSDLFVCAAVTRVSLGAEYKLISTVIASSVPHYDTLTSSFHPAGVHYAHGRGTYSVPHYVVSVSFGSSNFSLCPCFISCINVRGRLYTELTKDPGEGVLPRTNRVSLKIEQGLSCRYRRMYRASTYAAPI